MGKSLICIEFTKWVNKGVLIVYRDAMTPVKESLEKIEISGSSPKKQIKDRQAEYVGSLGVIFKYQQSWGNMKE